ncbi:MAG: MBL fold metallo-hydrolase [Lachnospiraceae bacterium]|nr:MBL fold metallo-hydrolase [Lachnospiraceae bacterium]
MFVRCIGTGSSGNCYALYDNDGKILLLDLGLSERIIKKAIDFRISDVVGTVVTHSHLDHSKAVKDFENMGIPVFAPYKSLEPMSFKYGSRVRVQAFDLTDKNGKFMHTNNDGSECPCYGFLIEHEDMGKMLYITDTELVKWRFSGINHILISCNYDKDLIPQDHPAREHIFRGHMELQTVKEFIKSNKSNTIRTVILCHLSQENADPDKMLAEVKKVTGESVKCVCAVAGETVELSQYPF